MLKRLKFKHLTLQILLATANFFNFLYQTWFPNYFLLIIPFLLIFSMSRCPSGVNICPPQCLHRGLFSLCWWCRSDPDATFLHERQPPLTNLCFHFDELPSFAPEKHCKRRLWASKRCFRRMPFCRKSSQYGLFLDVNSLASGKIILSVFQLLLGISIYAFFQFIECSRRFWACEPRLRPDQCNYSRKHGKHLKSNWILIP